MTGGHRVRRGGHAVWTIGPAFALVTLIFGVLVIVLAGYSFSADPGGRPFSEFGWQTWTKMVDDGYTFVALKNSLNLALWSSVLCVVPAIVIALALWRTRSRVAVSLWIAALLAPTLVAVVVRAHGWLLLLSSTGPLGDRVSGWLYDWPAVLLAQVHTLLPFAVIPIYIALRKIPPSVVDAAKDLGGDELVLHLRVLFPLSIHGIFSSVQLVFTMAVSSYAVPALLGGGKLNLLPQAIYQSIQNVIWPVAAAQAVILLVATLLVILALRVAATVVVHVFSDGGRG